MKNLENIFVYQVCEYDAVAAKSLSEALDFYEDLTGLVVPDIYEYHEIKEVSKNQMVYCDENKTSMVSVQQILEEYWKGEPFVVFSCLY